MSKTILTVDDSSSIRQMISFTLTQAGHRVVEAMDGMEALQKLAKTVPDLMITDLNMPRMDGMELVRKVREIPALKFLPILFLTTEGQEQKRQQARAAGATGWIVKPFKAEQLVTIVQKVLR